MTTALSIGARLQQFALAQLDHAIDELTAGKHKPDTAIHETRRCVKRVRALLRLVKAELPATGYDRDNSYLRKIGRQLSALRDAAVVEETLAALKKEFSAHLPPRTWRELKQAIVVCTRASDEQKEKRMVAVAAKLRTVRARVENWSLEFADRAALERGLRKAYRRGQRARTAAIAEPNADNFHEWRKQVNHLRHQLQLFQTLRLGKARLMLRRFKSLADLLGLKNDLAVLTHHLRRDQTKTARWLGVQPVMDARDQVYTEEAIALGQQLYQPPAKALLRAIWPKDLRQS